MSMQSVFIVSVPRSGSTVLTNLLDAYEDVICPPESFFPAVLDQLADDEMSDTRKVAALFVVSCSDGSPLKLEEAEACIRRGKKETLDSLAMAIARKLGREPEKLRTVVWKFTRMVGCWGFPAAMGGKFIILRRNLLNVYESQFRVPFGEKNRNPARFALFAASYDRAFSIYPSAATLELEYSAMPVRMPELLEWIGSAGVKRAESGGSLDLIAGSVPWHSGINKPFENRDQEKLRNLSPVQTAAFRSSRLLFRFLSPVASAARRAADRRQMAALRSQADTLLNQT